MALTANVRLYGPTDQTDGVKLTVDHGFGTISDADAVDETRLVAYFDLNYPGEYASHGQQSSSVDVTGTLDDFRELVATLQSFISVNEAEPAPEPDAPLVLIHVDGGIAEQWYVAPGAGEPEVHILDFDRGDEDEDDTADFVQRGRETLALFKARGIDTSDLDGDLDDLADQS